MRSIHLWMGAISISGLIGLRLRLLVAPPGFPADKGERGGY